ncbi:MAG: very short patch repair endonuclease [Elusimicrobia bacterium]|nr:very short patch repair endonuclease [Elusimicrobiota bacterium]
MNMVDIFSKRKRSMVMSAIKGKDGRTTELALRKMSLLSGICGRRSNPQNIFGKLDFFPSQWLVVFTDGCFWHGCRRCGYRERIRSSPAFWRLKIQRNILRDRRVNRQLKKDRWFVLRLWEHQIKEHPGNCLSRVLNFLLKA